MMKINISILLVSVMILTLSCNREGKNKVTLTHQSECLDQDLKSENDNRDSIYYEYSNGSLYIQHFNAGFNCCPEKILIGASLEAGKITVIEQEKDGLCACMCLYQINYEIENISAESYHLLINEPYIGDGLFLEADINLSDNPSGGFAVERNTYPWYLGE